jgi:disulfide bond formation protein DsbB
MLDTLKTTINKYKKYFFYKFLSILGYLELVVFPSVLAYVYAIENPNLRPLGTIFIAECCVIIAFPITLLLFGGLFLEDSIRKNLEDKKRAKLTTIGFIIYSLNLIIGFALFLFTIYLIKV